MTWYHAISTRNLSGKKWRAERLCGFKGANDRAGSSPHGITFQLRSGQLKCDMGKKMVSGFLDKSCIIIVELIYKIRSLTHDFVRL